MNFYSIRDLRTDANSLGEQSPFQSALADFTYEMASGAAIRHLTDLGYTVREISESLSYPTPLSRIQKQTWDRLVETGVILLQEPGTPRETSEFVKVYDQYGRASFRKVVQREAGQGNSRLRNPGQGTAIAWKKVKVCVQDRKQLSALLQDKIAGNGEENSYAACNFALLAVKDPEKYREILTALDKGNREYVEGLPWEKGLEYAEGYPISMQERPDPASKPQRQVYHGLNDRMQRILFQLLDAGLWQRDCYFLGTEEWLCFGP